MSIPQLKSSCRVRPEGLARVAGRTNRVMRSLAVCFVAMMMASCGSSGDSAATAKEHRVVIAWNSTPDVQYLPMFMAIEDLRKQGYNIVSKTLSGADVTAQALSGNRVQFTHVNIAGIANAASQGAPIRIVSATSDNPAVWVTKAGFKDCSSLTGKPVGIYAPAASSGYTKQMKQYFSKLCPDVEPKLVTIPDSALRAQALANDQIVATVLARPDVIRLKQKLDPSGKYHTTEFSNVFPGLADNYLYANKQVRSNFPKIVSALLEAQLRAVRRIYQNPSEYQQLLKQYLKPEMYTQESAQGALKSKTWYPNGGLDKEGLSGLRTTLKVFKLPGEAKELVDRDLLKQVLNKIGHWQESEQ